MMQPETITIEKIVNGGYGLGHIAGQVVLVRHVLPGETVRVKVKSPKKTHLIAELAEILDAHRQRRQPPCPHAGQCGGCDLQHAAYSLQLGIKKAILAELLQRATASLAKAADELADPLAAPAEFGYRQRLRLQVDSRGRLGYHRHQSHDIVAITDCPLASAMHNRILTLCGIDSRAKKLSTLASEVEILENPDSGRAVLIFHLRRKPRPADLAAAKTLVTNSPEIEGVYLRGEGFPLLGPFWEKGGERANHRLHLSYPPSPTLPHGLALSWEVGGFCQVNLAQNRALIDTVLAFSQPQPGQRILDLYCGMGNFAIPLALQGAEVHGIEGQAAAIRSATANAATYPEIAATFRQSPIDVAVAELLGAGISYHCLVIDPPRAGAPELASALAKLTAQRLVYISCDPATLCRDLGQLLESGFSIRKIQPIDMFPQTHHIETVVLLEK